MEAYMMVSGTSRPIKDTAEVTKSGKTDPSTMATGRMVLLMDEEDSYMLMVTYMMATGRMIKHMERDNIRTPMVLNMMGSGLKINKKVKVRRNGWMGLAMLEIIRTERNKGKAISSGQMAPSTKEISSKITSKETEHTDGLIRDSSLVNGKTTKCMAPACLLGMTAGNTKVSIWMTKNQDTVFSHGQMEDSMTASGNSVNKKAQEYTTTTKTK